MTYRDENAARLGAALGKTYQRRADTNCTAYLVQSPKIPAKWKRVLTAFLSGQSYNRFEATRDLRDWSLHSTVSTIQSKGVRIERKSERVPGYLGLATEVCRYWLDLKNTEAVTKAKQLVGEALGEAV